MKRFWCLFFLFWPIVGLVVCWVAPALDWWFPGEAMSPLGRQIDDLFFLILVIVTVTFIGTQSALAFVLFKGAKIEKGKAWFSHGSHNLEVIWTIVPAGILLFIALYQMDVWAQFRITSTFPVKPKDAIAEVVARQFEWRIRYPAPGKELQPTPQPDDLYTVNDLHVPVATPVLIQLRSMDVQHAFFVPDLRVKQDAVPNLIIPVWFEASKAGDYEFLCAELCGWGHYKMKARLVAENEEDFESYLHGLQQEMQDDGVSEESAPTTEDGEGEE